MVKLLVCGGRGPGFDFLIFLSYKDGVQCQTECGETGSYLATKGIPLALYNSPNYENESTGVSLEV